MFFHNRFLPVFGSQLSGRPVSREMPFCSGPRQLGQSSGSTFLSAGAVLVGSLLATADAAAAFALAFGALGRGVARRSQEQARRGEAGQQSGNYTGLHWEGSQEAGWSGSWQGGAGSWLRRAELRRIRYNRARHPTTLPRQNRSHLKDKARPNPRQGYRRCAKPLTVMLSSAKPSPICHLADESAGIHREPPRRCHVFSANAE